jgi:erythromycin esterase
LKLDANTTYTGEYALLMEAGEAPEAEFGNTMKSFPASLVAGKRITYSAMIKSAEVADGYAGIWWRAEGDIDVLSFGSSKSQFDPSGLDWAQHSITLDIPEEAERVYFGMILRGGGKAWFDDQVVTIDGEPYEEEVEAFHPLTADQRTYLQDRIIPLHSYDPEDARTDDLAALMKLIGPASVVGLGESTHGSSAIFQLKHRIYKYLVRQAGFTQFSIEANLPEAYATNGFIREGKGEASDYLRSMQFWT